MPQTLRIIDGQTVLRAIGIAEVIPLMRRAFSELSAGVAQVPLRTHLPAGEGVALFMPVSSPACEYYAVKCVSLHQGNRALGLPLIHGMLLLFDSASGEPRALMDAEQLTALRTGAASGVATDLLASPSASTCAVFGCGIQARTQLLAISTVRELQQVLVFARDKDKAAQFSREMEKELGLAVRLAADPTELSDASIVVTATNSATPVFSDAHLRDGAHINAIGSFRPVDREIPEQTVLRADVIVDQRLACLREAGELVLPIQAGKADETLVRAELGELVNGSARPADAAKRISLFKSVGNAVQDLYTAAAVLQACEDRHMGALISLQN